MVEKDTSATEHAVRLPIVHIQVISRNLADAIRTSGMKWRGRTLRRFTRAPEHLTGSCEVEFTSWLDLAYACEQIVRSIDIRVHGRESIGKTLRNKALSSQMITLVKLTSSEDLKDAWIAFEARCMEYQPFADV